MKKTILYITIACLLACPAYATYHEYTTDIYTPGLTLGEGDSFYMTDGGFDSLDMIQDDITATIEGTSPLVEGSGGIWELNLGGDNTHLDFSGGEMKHLDIGNDATAFLSGGLIQQIYSYQYTGSFGPHITIECLDHFYNDDTNLLTGHWYDDGLFFSIQLYDVGGYSPAISNIQFIPEPATLALLGLGALVLRKQKR